MLLHVCGEIKVLKHGPPHVGYQTEFDRCWSNDGDPPKNWAPRVPPVKAIQGHLTLTLTLTLTLILILTLCVSDK